MLRRRRYVFNCAAAIRNYNPQRARSARVCTADGSSCRRRRRRTSPRSRQVQRSCSKATSVSSTYSLCKQWTVGIGQLSTAALDLPLPTAILGATARSVCCCWCGCGHLCDIVCLWQSVVAPVRPVSGGCSSAGSLLARSQASFVLLYVTSHPQCDLAPLPPATAI